MVYFMEKKQKNELWDDLGAPPILGNLQVSLQTGAGGSRLEHRGVLMGSRFETGFAGSDPRA